MRRIAIVLRALPFAALLALRGAEAAPAQGDYCPLFLRVPGYGACTAARLEGCDFCKYTCNAETIVHWNVCRR